MLQSSPIVHQTHIINVLAIIRKEWQEAARGDSLFSIEGNVGLILADIINGLGLPVDVQVEILGAELFCEMQDLLNVSSHCDESSRPGAAAGQNPTREM